MSPVSIFCSAYFMVILCVVVMSSIIHNYRHLSIAMCNNSRIILEINIYRRKLLLHKDLGVTGQGGVLSCRLRFAFLPEKAGVV